MTHLTEFTDYDPTTLPPIPADWKDGSWHNDTCPSWYTPAGLQVFVDYEKPSDREFPECKRFTVLRLEEGVEELLHTDVWDEVLKAV